MLAARALHVLLTLLLNPSWLVAKAKRRQMAGLNLKEQNMVVSYKGGLQAKNLVKIFRLKFSKVKDFK